MSHSFATETILATATRHCIHVLDSVNECESLIENRHWGWVAQVDLQKSQLYFTPGAERLATFFRSSAKPFQAFPLVEAGYASELTQEELAITCASHTGSLRHLELVQKILKKAGLPETALQCGPHFPLDETVRHRLRSQRLEPGAIHNNCSGKHAGMLLYCQCQALDYSTYLNPEHPLQQAILATLRKFSGVEDIPLAIDGCGAPVFYLPLSAMAKLYAVLGLEESFNPIRNAMTSYPELVGGLGRVDTVLMQVSQGSILAKVGADGVLCASHVEQGQGVALKMADGLEPVRNLVFVEILCRLGWLDATALQDPRLVPYRDLNRMNTQNRIIGAYQIHFDPQKMQAAPL